MGNENFNLQSESESERETKQKAFRKYLDELSAIEKQNDRIEFKIFQLEKRVEYLEAVVDSIWNGDESESTTDKSKTELSDEETRLPF